MPRSMASAASSFMSPPPWPRRTTSFSRSASRSGRRRPGGRRRGGSCWCRCRAPPGTGVPPSARHDVSRRSGCDVQASRPSSTPSRKLAIFSNPLPSTSSVDASSPTTSAVWIASSRSPGSMTARVAASSPWLVGDEVVPPRRRSGSRRRGARGLAGQRAAERLPGPPRSTPRRACSRRRSRRSGRRGRGPAARRGTPRCVAGQYTAPVANDRRRARRTSTSSADCDRHDASASAASAPTAASAVGQKSLRSVGDEARRSASSP